MWWIQDMGAGAADWQGVCAAPVHRQCEREPRRIPTGQSRVREWPHGLNSALLLPQREYLVHLAFIIFEDEGWVLFNVSDACTSPLAPRSHSGLSSRIAVQGAGTGKRAGKAAPTACRGALREQPTPGEDQVC